MAKVPTRYISSLLKKHGWDVEYFKGFILGLVWLRLYHKESRYDAFLDLEAGSLTKDENTLLDTYAQNLESDIHANRYRFSPGCKVHQNTLSANYKKDSKLFQWASGVYMACRIMEVMVEDGDVQAQDADAYMMDRIAESVFPFLDKEFALGYFSEVNEEKIDAEICIDLLTRLRKDLPKIINDLSDLSQFEMNNDEPYDDAPQIVGPIDSVHSYFAGVKDSDAIASLADHMLPVIMEGNKKQRIKQLEELLSYARKGVGESFFEENRGEFWSIMETRPYMRVLTALAEAYKCVLKREKAISCYKQALELCREDNLGARYLLAELYLEQHDIDSAIALIHQFKNDKSAMLKYTYVVAQYLKQSDSCAAINALKDAHASNAYVISFLIGDLALPTEPPEYYSIGDESEAIIYCHHNKLLWRNTQGLLVWVKNISQRFNLLAPTAK